MPFNSFVSVGSPNYILNCLALGLGKPLLRVKRLTVASPPMHEVLGITSQSYGLWIYSVSLLCSFEFS